MWKNAKKYFIVYKEFNEASYLKVSEEFYLHNLIIIIIKMYILSIIARTVD